MKNKQLTTGLHTYTSVIRKELVIGEKVISAFMDAQGKYYLNFNQIEELLKLARQSFIGFLAQTGLLETARIHTLDELRSLWAKGLIAARGVHYVQTETGAKFRAAELDLVAKFILEQAYKGNQLAQTLNNALLLESLQIRCECAFVGVSPNVSEVIEESNKKIWSLFREEGQAIHGAFDNHCKSLKLPAGHVHDRMTKLVFGQTARMAITTNLLVGENRYIGLDYQKSAEGQEKMAKMKARFMSYKKGTWQERVDRSFNELN